MNKAERNLHSQQMLLLKELHLPMFREYYDPLANQALQQDMSYSRYLYELAVLIGWCTTA